MTSDDRKDMGTLSCQIIAVFCLPICLPICLLLPTPHDVDRFRPVWLLSRNTVSKEALQRYVSYL